MISRPWTDDLPKCRNSCVGQYFPQVERDTNCVDEDLCFYCEVKDNTCLYGVFEPHNGLDTARFVMQRMAAEVLFSQLNNNTTDEEIKDILRNAFVSVEKAYVESIDEMLAERTSLQYRLQPSDDGENCGQILLRLKEIDQQLSAGTTVVIALIHSNKLFVANVGESRALLCKTDENSVLRVVQLSVDHSLNNEDELLRLSQLGLDMNKLRNFEALGNQYGTRCMGNYLVKGLYQAFPDLGHAFSEPVVAVPEIHGPIVLDDSCRFLVLVSADVYKRIQDVKGCSEQTNKQLAQIIVENFRKQSNFSKVSQAVLEEIVSQFSTYCSKHQLSENSDAYMTLLIRNFNFLPPKNRMPPSTNSNMCGNVDRSQKTANASVRFNPIVQSKSHTLVNNLSDSDTYTNKVESTSPNNSTLESSSRNTQGTETQNSLTSTTESSSDIYPAGKFYDRNKKVKSYVDFSPYFENVEKARNLGLLPSFIE